MRDENVRAGFLFLAWAHWIWPPILTLVFLSGARLRSRRTAFFVLGTLICFGCLCVAGAITTRWQYDVTKSLSAGDQIAIIWIKAGVAAQCISFFFSMPFLYLLRREFGQRSVI
jgi:uncharacterized membrane protein YbhN (UPF0104 family)